MKFYAIESTIREAYSLNCEEDVSFLGFDLFCCRGGVVGTGLRFHRQGTAGLLSGLPFQNAPKGREFLL